ncbi:hypothetical protein HNY73_006228 [Argiope bruennichi]|uniref:Uncharacterized protein n=1 Tax=Argiope bruennichi TaxID=94029 RepID=A0A8T0FRK7_ARGBR|nr:hypothetical protein HNY73_006228 [Argiope bruennichi]
MKYPAITKLPDPNQPVKHNAVHYINSKGPPVSAKPRRLAPDRLKIAKAEVQRMIHLVLLGIRTAVKEDIKASCAEPVYEKTLQLPSDMIETSIIPPCDDIFVDRLRNTMRELNPVATSAHGKTKFYVNPSLKTCSHVFLSIDSMKPPLCQPFTGSHKVLKQTQKNFTIELNGRTSTVSIDRVKPAYLIPTCEEKTRILHAEETVSPANFRSDKQQSDDQTVPDKTVTTRSGRRVHFPSKLSTYTTY